MTCMASSQADLGREYCKIYTKGQAEINDDCNCIW
jgi:hypothetical protein